MLNVYFAQNIFDFFVCQPTRRHDPVVSEGSLGKAECRLHRNGQSWLVPSVTDHFCCLSYLDQKAGLPEKWHRKTKMEVACLVQLAEPSQQYQCKGSWEEAGLSFPAAAHTGFA